MNVELDDAAGTAKVIGQVDETQRNPLGAERGFSRGSQSYKRVTWTPGRGKRTLDASDLRRRVLGAVQEAGWRPVADTAPKTGAVIGLSVAAVVIVAILVVGLLVLVGGRGSGSPVE